MVMNVTTLVLPIVEYVHQIQNVDGVNTLSFMDRIVSTDVQPAVSADDVIKVMDIVLTDANLVFLELIAIHAHRVITVPIVI
jgi:hypothetical protein